MQMRDGFDFKENFIFFPPILVEMNTEWLVCLFSF